MKKQAASGETDRKTDGKIVTSVSEDHIQNEVI